MENVMKKMLFIAAAVCAVSAPAFAEDVGVRVGPVGAGVTVGASPEYRDRDRTTTIVKDRRPSDRTTVIKKESSDGMESKTVIRHEND
jgi:hypothetical protein